ncbi:flagellar hook-basal body complex protein FliE [Roseateles amylovorans]|uniref:Flagellar hook-basal body complex protein FliE n=1 Tax=Roseateles amylovorans TaxID=2978473 RepID=A0ABY6AUK7_9BURK|nr:flagellar hook-basal body complex protein FliE [Roseateles amylovorans]UXH76904.1 flagellar hook-basal body complex protein FliE [Roseateles amylovorans]
MSVSTINAAMAVSAMDSLLLQDASRLQQDAQNLISPSSDNLGSGSEATSMGFEQMLRRVDDRQQAANDRMEAVERGESDDLVGAMLSSQQASLSFSMLMQVRNKVVGAVDELIKLQL